MAKSKAQKLREKTISVKMVKKLFKAGKTITDIAERIGYKRGDGLNRVRLVLQKAKRVK